MAQNEELPAFAGFPEGVHIVDPIDDLRNFGDRVIEATIDRLRRAFGLAGSIPEYRVSEPLSRLVASMRQSYFGGAKTAMAPYVRHVLSDPLPCMLRNIKVLGGLVRRRRYFIPTAPEFDSRKGLHARFCVIQGCWQQGSVFNANDSFAKRL